MFHVYAHCVWATSCLYRDDVDRLEFLRRLAAASVRPDWTCMAFCLLTSHYHLIVEVGADVLPGAMHAINQPYARAFNERHRLRGHVQFDRYGARRIFDEEDMLGRYAYVANNPVEAGLCKSPADWLWSSYAGTIGVAQPQPFVDDSKVLACFSSPEDDPRAALRRRVEKL